MQRYLAPSVKFRPRLDRAMKKLSLHLRYFRLDVYFFLRILEADDGSLSNQNDKVPYKRRGSTFPQPRRIMC